MYWSDPGVYIPSNKAGPSLKSSSFIIILINNYIFTYILSICYKPDMVLGSGDIVANNLDKNLCFHTAYILGVGARGQKIS